MLSFTSNAHMLPTVSLTSHSRRQQLTPSPHLSTLSLSITHTHHEEATDNDLASLSSLFSSHRWDEKWLSSIISKTDSPTDLLSAFKPSLLEFMEKIKCGVKLRFLLNSASLQQNPTQSLTSYAGICLKGDRAYCLIPLNPIGCEAGEQCGGPGGGKCLHMWVLTCAGM